MNQPTSPNALRLTENINWDANIVRLYDGAAWQPIGDFETDAWKYIRIVTDFDKSEFDFYAGDSRDAALNAKPEKGARFIEKVEIDNVDFGLRKGTLLHQPIYANALRLTEIRLGNDCRGLRR